MDSQPSTGDKGLGPYFSKDAAAIRDLYVVRLLTHREARALLAEIGLRGHLKPWPWDVPEAPPPFDLPPPAEPLEKDVDLFDPDRMVSVGN